MYMCVYLFTDQITHQQRSQQVIVYYQTEQHPASILFPFFLCQVKCAQVQLSL